MTDEPGRFRTAALKIIDARVSVSTWILLFISTGIAAILAMYTIAEPQRIEEFTRALPLFDGVLWSVILTLSGFLTGLFLALKKDKWSSWASFSSFLLWVFGALSFWAIQGQATVVLIILPLIVFHAYLVLAPVLRDNNGI